MRSHTNWRIIMRKMILPLLCVGFFACTRSQRMGTVIQNKGSDTMVNLAQGWAEAYRDVKGGVSVAVTGGGSGTGIAALMNGTVDLANSSRAIKLEEAAAAKNNTGKAVVGSVVALDALSVFIHKDNPLRQLSLLQLACIYGEGGKCERWSDLGLKAVPGCQSGEIVRISRQSNSGTYQYFREVISEKKDFKLGSRDMHGSKDVVDLVEKTPCAIGYSGMGYHMPGTKSLCISKNTAGPCVLPTVKTALDKSYPIARELYMYTLGEPTGELKNYLDWIRGPQGQKIVSQMGYVPYPKSPSRNSNR